MTYTTLGHEPFLIHNSWIRMSCSDQQLHAVRGRHSLTFGANFEKFSFFNSFNIFRNGVFFLPVGFPTASHSDPWPTSSP